VKAARGEAGKHASRCEPQAALVAEVRLVLQQAGRAKAPAEEGEAAAAVEVAAAEAAAAEGLQVSSGAYVVRRCVITHRLLIIRVPPSGQPVSTGGSEKHLTGKGSVFLG
jgi:hypothetical protein